MPKKSEKYVQDGSSMLFSPQCQAFHGNICIFLGVLQGNRVTPFFWDPAGIQPAIGNSMGRQVLKVTL